MKRVQSIGSIRMVFSGLAAYLILIVVGIPIVIVEGAARWVSYPFRSRAKTTNKGR